MSTTHLQRSKTPGREWDREAAEAWAVERAEARQAAERRPMVVLLVLAAVVAAVAAGVLPFTPGFSTSNVAVAAVAAAVVGAVSMSVVFMSARLASRAQLFLVTAAFASAGAAAIHFAAAKMHFEEYALFGVFFVGSGIAQLAWPIWALLRPARWLLLLGAVGNAAIVVLWAVDRIVGLPLGPEPWKPDPFGLGDTVSAAFELLIVAVCLSLLLRPRSSPLHRMGFAGPSLAATALTTLSLLSLLGVAPSLLPPSH